MPALVAGIHVLHHRQTKDVDGRDKPGHPGEETLRGRDARMSNNRIAIPRRQFVGGLAASAAIAAAPLGAAAQTYPNRRISVIIPTGQGGGAERIARPFDAAWGALLKAQF